MAASLPGLPGPPLSKRPTQGENWIDDDKWPADLDEIDPGEIAYTDPDVYTIDNNNKPTTYIGVDPGCNYYPQNNFTPSLSPMGAVTNYVVALLICFPVVFLGNHFIVQPLQKKIFKWEPQVDPYLQKLDQIEIILSKKLEVLDKKYSELDKKYNEVLEKLL